MLDLKERDQRIKEWIKEATSEIKQSMQNEIKVEEKTNAQDLVTNVDKNTEEFLVGKIHKHYPNENIISEEGYGDHLTDLRGIVWFIDPIDGTTNFITQKENFAIMIAVYKDGVGHLGYIYDVMGDKLYSGIKNQGAYIDGERISEIKNTALSQGVLASSTHIMTKENYAPLRELANQSLGVRMLGSAGLEICQVSMSKTVAYMASTLSPWDIAPGQVIANEVGVISTNLKGEPLNLLQNNQVVFANPSAHKQIINALKINKIK